MNRFSSLSSLDFKRIRGPEHVYRVSKYYQLLADFPLLNHRDPATWTSMRVNTHSGQLIKHGNVLPIQDLFLPPTVNINDPPPPDSTKNTSSLPPRFVAMFDLDSPDVKHKTMKVERLWMQKIDTNGTDDDPIVPYTPPCPSLGTGFHRFVFVLLQQKPIPLEPADYLKIDPACWNVLSWAFCRSVHSPSVSKYLESMHQPESIYGHPLPRSWKQVTRRLYPHAYQ